MKFLLDTDGVSYALRGEGGVADQIRAPQPSELGISAITLAELRFGAERRRSRRLNGLIQAFVGDVAFVPFDDGARARCGKVAAALMSKGTPIGALDTMIPARALQLGLTLVTHNTKYLKRVRDLEIADWL